jgi:two-component system sensor histidine kinase KdpD
MRPTRHDFRAIAIALAGIASVTVVFRLVVVEANVTTVALSLLLVVLVTAATSRLVVAVATSIAAVLTLNYFFLPPVGTWTIADSQNWIALFAFLAVSLVASRLSDAARDRAQEAMVRRDELARLFDLSRDVMAMATSPEAAGDLARAIARRFDLDFVAVALPEGGRWSIATGGARRIELDEPSLTEAFDAASRVLEFDAALRAYAGHRTVVIDQQEVRVVPLRAGTRPIGLLVAAGRPVEPGTLDALGGVAAIALERMRFLEERQAAELAAQRGELKTALLASLGHDLRTPVTAIRVASENLRSSSLTEPERADQAAIILEETTRLSRLFENILQMTRIDADAIERGRRWTHPSEIIAAARDQAAPGVDTLVVNVALIDDGAVQVDARLIASALAQLLANAAQHAPPGSTVEVIAGVAEHALRIDVRDHGRGIALADLPHLFDRFYRGGASSRQRPAGSGLGLWIARQLVGAAGGRIWAENCEDGGARFTISVPVLATDASPASS